MKNIISRLSALIIIAFSSAAFEGCTVGGDIGVFYGQWVIDEATCDGVELPEEDFDSFAFRFCGNVLHIDRTYPMHITLTWVGSWSKEGNTLILNCQYVTSDFSAETKEIGLEPVKMSMQIEKETFHELRLRYVNSQGKVYTYKWRKLA